MLLWVCCFLDLNQTHARDAVFDVFVHTAVNIVQSGGIEIRGLNSSAINRRKPLGDPVIEKYMFVPNNNGTMNRHIAKYDTSAQKGP